MAGCFGTKTQQRLQALVAASVDLKNPTLSACRLELAPIRAAGRLLRSRDLLIASHPLMEALGRVVAPFGLRPEQYQAAR